MASHPRSVCPVALPTTPAARVAARMMPPRTLTNRLVLVNIRVADPGDRPGAGSAGSSTGSVPWSPRVYSSFAKTVVWTLPLSCENT